MKQIYKDINEMNRDEMKTIHLKNKLGVCHWIMIGLLAFKFIWIMCLISTGSI